MSKRSEQNQRKIIPDPTGNRYTKLPNSVWLIFFISDINARQFANLLSLAPTISGTSISGGLNEITKWLRLRYWTFNQGFGSAFIWSGSGASVWGWRPIRIRIQSGSRALMTKNWKKITAEKEKYFFFKSKNAIYLSLGLHKVCPSYRRSL